MTQTISNDKNLKILRLVLIGVWLVVLYMMFRPAIGATKGAFKDPVNDMMHGWLIPPVSLVAAWTLRHKLRDAAGRPAWGGFAVLAVMCALLWFGQRGGQSRFSQLAMILSIPAVAWIGWGRKVARILLFPTAYLLFIIPMNFLDFITLPLRLMSTVLSTALLNGLGVDVIRSGSSLISATGKFHLDVIDPCSGIKSIFAIMSLSAAYGFFYQKTALRVLLLMACSIPLAVIANIVRLTTIGIVANMFGQDRAMEIFHELSGFLTFPVAILLMLLLGEKVICKIGREPPDTPVTPPMKQLRWPAGLAALIMGIALTATMLTTLNRMKPTALDPDTFIVKEFPPTMGGMQSEPIWYCHEQACLVDFPDSKITTREDGKPVCPNCGNPLFTISLSEKLILPKDTFLLKRVYENAHSSYTVTMVVSGESRVSIHRPDMCLPGQGYVVVAKTIHTLVLDNGKKLDVMLYRVHRAGTETIGFANFLVSDHVQTASHFHRIVYDIWQRSIYGRINRWAMFTIVSNTSFETEEGLEQLRTMLSEWLPQVYTGTLPDAE